LCLALAIAPLALRPGAFRLRLVALNPLRQLNHLVEGEAHGLHCFQGFSAQDHAPITP